MLLNIFRGIQAYLKLDKSMRRAFKRLSHEQKAAFFRLSSDDSRQEFLLFLSILKANDQLHIIKTVETVAPKTGAPAVELYNHLLHEARIEREQAKTKLDSVIHKDRNKHQYQEETDTEIVEIPDMRELNQRLKLLNEREQFRQRTKRFSR